MILDQYAILDLKVVIGGVGLEQSVAGLAVRVLFAVRFGRGFQVGQLHSFGQPQRLVRAVFDFRRKLQFEVPEPLIRRQFQLEGRCDLRQYKLRFLRHGSACANEQQHGQQGGKYALPM